MPTRCDELKRREKTFVIIGLLITVIICGGLYINHQLDRIVTTLSSSGLIFVYPEDEHGFLAPGAPGAPENGSSQPGQRPPAAHAPGDGGFEKDPGLSTPGKDNLPEDGDGDGDGDGLGRLEKEIAAAVQQKLARPLEKKDLLKAGLLILLKLNKDEILYLYRIGTQDSYTREELQSVREILLAKLSAKDIDTLQKIGAKYGKRLRILDADIRLE